MHRSGSDGLFARGGAREAVAERARLRGRLDCEAALARASARAGVPLPAANSAFQLAERALEE